MTAKHPKAGWDPLGLDPFGEYSECAYCHRPIPTEVIHDVPAPGDDEAWADVALEHANDCEWLLTRAHRLNLKKE